MYFLWLHIYSYSTLFHRDAGEDISTNSDECNYPPCIPYHSSSLSSKSDGGYGTKSKSIDDSFKAKSHKRSEGGGTWSIISLSIELHILYVNYIT